MTRQRGNTGQACGGQEASTAATKSQFIEAASPGIISVPDLHLAMCGGCFHGKMAWGKVLVASFTYVTCGAKLPVGSSSPFPDSSSPFPVLYLLNNNVLDVWFGPVAVLGRGSGWGLRLRDSGLPKTITSCD